MRIFWSWIAPGARTRGQALAEDGRALFTVALGLTISLFVSGCIEGFVTPSPLPWPVKIGIGALALAGVPLLHARSSADARRERGRRATSTPSRQAPAASSPTERKPSPTDKPARWSALICPYDADERPPVAVENCCGLGGPSPTVTCMPRGMQWFGWRAVLAMSTALVLAGCAGYLRACGDERDADAECDAASKRVAVQRHSGLYVKYLTESATVSTSGRRTDPARLRPYLTPAELATRRWR